jgi:hypothetical protein
VDVNDLDPFTFQEAPQSIQSQRQIPAECDNASQHSTADVHRSEKNAVRVCAPSGQGPDPIAAAWQQEKGFVSAIVQTVLELRHERRHAPEIRERKRHHEQNLHAARSIA